MNRLAFPTSSEAELVDLLRDNGRHLLSLVATDDGEIVGHILFSPVHVDTERARVVGAGLAPMAVLPGRQRGGVGSRLVREGLSTLGERGERFVIVLGHAEYYPRFGFQRASLHGVRCPWEGVPDKAFMVRVLDDELHGRLAGIAWYGPEFAL